MFTKFVLQIKCVNDKGKEYIQEEQFDTMINVVRFMLVFKAKKGYKIMSYFVSEELVLV